MERNKRIGALVAAIGISLCSLGASAADRTNLHDRDVAQLKGRYQAAVAKQGLAQMAHTRHERFLGVDAETYLVMQAMHREENVTNYRYRQTWRGIPVHGDTVVVGEDRAGNVKRLYGSLVEGIHLPSTTPKLSADEAFEKAKDAWLGNSASSYKVENAKQELVVYVTPLGNARLAYSVDFFAHTVAGKPTRPLIIIDAQSGVALEKRENLQTSEHTGTGPGGNTKTGKYGYGVIEPGGNGVVYGYLDITRSAGNCTFENDRVVTYDMNQTPVITSTLNAAGTSIVSETYGPVTQSLVSYACASAPYRHDGEDAVNGGYSAVNDAHHFGSVIFDMYQSYLAQAPLNKKLLLYVHYATQYYIWQGNTYGPYGYENAFWNGSAMYFGDGDTSFYPLVSLDVTSHEVSHGYTEQNSNLTYTGQSGGINESFSDMAGEAAEYFDRGSNDWKVGYDIYKGTAVNDDALRYMDDPTRDGTSIGNAANYTAGMDVHYSSGVYNKAFYLLSTTAGWDTSKAFKVFARANRDYWTASVDYNYAACGSLDAASDLGFSVANVATALAGVGVTCPNAAATATEIFDAVPVPGLSGAKDSARYFYIDVPGAQGQLVVTTTGGSGNADLLVKFGSVPVDGNGQSGSFDCKSATKNTNVETCTISQPNQGRYYVLVQGAAAYSSVTLMADYSATGLPTITTLTKAVAASVGSVTQPNNKYYKFQVPAGAVNLTFKLTDAAGAGNGDADEFVSYESLPSTSIYDAAGALNGDDADELVSFTWPKAGWYYIAVNAYNNISGYTITADYDFDTSGPTIVAVETTTPDGDNGWYRIIDASVRFDCSDVGGSYVTDCPGAETLSIDGANVQSTPYIVHDALGNASAPSNRVTVKIDKTVPTITASTSPAPNGAGWNNTPVTLTFTCVEETSGLLLCPGRRKYGTEGANLATLPYRVKDYAGNISLPANVVTMKIDLTAPTVAATPTTSPNANGWYTGDVTIGYACSDALSGVASCSGNAVVTGRGAAVPVPTGNGTDVAGNVGSNTAATLQIDSTGPVLAPSLDPGAVVQVGATLVASANATDAESGILIQGCTAADTSTPGSRTLTCTATNGAGTEVSVQVPYQVVASVAARRPRGAR